MRAHTFFSHLSPIIAVLQFLVRSIFSTDDSQSCISNRVLSRVWTISKCIINTYTLLFNTHLKLNLSQTELLILSKTFSSHCLSLPSNWHAMVTVAQATNPRGIFAFTLTLPSLTLPSIYSHNLTPSHHLLNTPGPSFLPWIAAVASQLFSPLLSLVLTVCSQQSDPFKIKANHATLLLPSLQWLPYTAGTSVVMRLLNQ